MTIGDATREYVKYKQALGQRFETEEVILRAFTKRIGRRTVVSKITAKTGSWLPGEPGKGDSLLASQARCPLRLLGVLHPERMDRPLPSPNSPAGISASVRSLHLLTGRAARSSGGHNYLPAKMGQAGAGHAAHASAVALWSRAASERANRSVLFRCGLHREYPADPRDQVLQKPSRRAQFSTCDGDARL